MGKNELSRRNIWQDIGGGKAAQAEYSFFHVFQTVFEKTRFTITAKPKELKAIYVEVPLSGKTISEIYNPPEQIRKHGIAPDYAITNSETGKTLYVEVKRQDGWVEGKSRSAGRGNAHERCCKYFAPGLLKILRKKAASQKMPCHSGWFFKGI